MLPVFAEGLKFETTLAAGAAAGQNVFAVADADQFIAPGDPVFIAEGDGSNAEFLGPSRSVDAASVTTAFATVSAKAAGARLWTPAQWHLFSAPPAPPMRRPVSTGVKTLVTVGGDVVQTRVATPVLREKLAFASLPRSACDNALAWLDTATNWGLYPFTYVDARRRVHTARLESAPVVQMETAPGLCALTLALILPGEPAS